MKWIILCLTFSTFFTVGCRGGDPTALGTLEFGSEGGEDNGNGNGNGSDNGNGGGIGGDGDGDGGRNDGGLFPTDKHQYARLTLHSGIHEAKNEHNETVHKVQLRVVDHSAPPSGELGTVYLQSVKRKTND